MVRYKCTKKNNQTHDIKVSALTDLTWNNFTSIHITIPNFVKGHHLFGVTPPNFWGWEHSSAFYISPNCNEEECF